MKTYHPLASEENTLESSLKSVGRSHLWQELVRLVHVCFLIGHKVAQAHKILWLQVKVHIATCKKKSPNFSCNDCREHYWMICRRVWSKPGLACSHLQQTPGRKKRGTFQSWWGPFSCWFTWYMSFICSFWKETSVWQRGLSENTVKIPTVHLTRTHLDWHTDAANARRGATVVFQRLQPLTLLHSRQC